MSLVEGSVSVDFQVRWTFYVRWTLKYVEELVLFGIPIRSRVRIDSRYVWFSEIVRLFVGLAVGPLERFPPRGRLDITRNAAGLRYRRVRVAPSSRGSRHAAG